MEDDEEYFPRGGSSGKIKAKKNYVFQPKTQNKEQKKKLGKRERKRLKKQKAQKTSHQENEDEDHEEDFEKQNLAETVVEQRMKKIQQLSYKNLVEGLVSLCSVNTVLSKSIQVALPERLLCTVTFPDVSSPLTADKSSTSFKSKTRDLTKIFKVGEFLACKIKSVERKNGDFVVHGSTDPAQVNSSLSFNDFDVGSVLYGSVKSLEDHGYIIHSGISGLTAFLPYKNCPPAPKGKTFAVGKLLWCTVVRATHCETSNTVQLSLNRDDFETYRDANQRITAESVNPGMELNLIVTKYLGRDMEMTVKGSDVRGFVPRSHLPTIADQASNFKIGTELSGTVLYKYPISNIAAFSLRIKPTAQKVTVLETGTIFHRAEIVYHDGRGLGVRFDHDGKANYGIISKRRMEGEMAGKSLEELFPKGNHMKVILIGYHHIDQLYSCSTENEMLTGKFLTMVQLKEMIGKVVTVTVKEINDKGAVVSLDNRTAFVPATQITDVIGAKPTQKLRVNEQHRGRIFKVNPKKNSVLVTLRPTLVNSKPLTDFSKASKGDSYYGSVCSIADFKIHVSFFNGLTAEILGENLIQDCRKYRIGELVKCYVIKEGHKGRPAPVFSQARHVDQMELSIGLTYKLIVKEQESLGIRCLLEEKNNLFHVFIPLELLSDHRELRMKKHQALTPGTIVDGHLFCYDSYLNPVFTLRESVRQFFQKEGERLLSNGHMALKNKKIVPAIVSDQTEDGYYLSVPIPLYNRKVLVEKEVLQQYPNVKAGEVVYLAVDRSSNPREFSLVFPVSDKHLHRWAINNLRSYLKDISAFQTFKTGDLVSGSATGVQNRCTLSDGRSGLIHMTKKENKSRLSCGQLLELFVLFEDLEKDVHLALLGSDEASHSGNPGQGASKTVERLEVIYVNEMFVVGKVPSGQIRFCPRILWPSSERPDVDGDLVSVGKSLGAELMCSEGDLFFGYLHLSGVIPPVQIATESTSCSINKKRKKSMNNIPASHKKKAKTTVVVPASSEKSAHPDEDSPRPKKKKKRKSEPCHSSNPLLSNPENIQTQIQTLFRKKNVT